MDAGHVAEHTRLTRGAWGQFDPTRNHYAYHEADADLSARALMDNVAKKLNGAAFSVITTAERQSVLCDLTELRMFRDQFRCLGAPTTCLICARVLRMYGRLFDWIAGEHANA